MVFYRNAQSGLLLRKSDKLVHGLAGHCCCAGQTEWPSTDCGGTCNEQYGLPSQILLSFVGPIFQEYDGYNCGAGIDCSALKDTSFTLQRMRVTGEDDIQIDKTSNRFLNGDIALYSQDGCQYVWRGNPGIQCPNFFEPLVDGFISLSIDEIYAYVKVVAWEDVDDPVNPEYVDNLRFSWNGLTPMVNKNCKAFSDFNIHPDRGGPDGSWSGGYSLAGVPICDRVTDATMLITSL